MAETELIERLQSGDAAAYRLVLQRNYASVFACCFGFVDDRETAEDLTQEVFVELHRSIHAFRGRSALSTWIYRIAVSKSLDHLRYMKRLKRFSFLTRLLPGDGKTDQIPGDDSQDPHVLLEARERLDVLQWAMGALPDNQRAAFTLSACDGLSYREIAGILNTTEPAVESLMVRARAKLRKKLHAYYTTQMRRNGRKP